MPEPLLACQNLYTQVITQVKIEQKKCVDVIYAYKKGCNLEINANNEKNYRCD